MHAAALQKLIQIILKGNKTFSAAWKQIPATDCILKNAQMLAHF